MEHAVDGGAADPVALRQLTQALSPLTVLEDGGPVEIEGLPADVAALQLGAAHPGAHPLGDQVPFELGDGPR